MDYLQLLKENENQTLTILYQLHQQNSINYLRKKFSLSKEDGQEIFQYAIVVFYDQYKSGKLIKLTCKVENYLLSICINKSHEVLRKRNKDRNIDAYQLLHDYNFDEEQYAYQTELLAKELDLLPLKHKKLLQLFYHKNYSLTRISEMLNYKNADTAKNLKCKIIKKLRYNILVQYSAQITENSHN